MTPAENRPTPSRQVSFGPFLSLMKPPMRLPKTKANSMNEETRFAEVVSQS